MGAARQTRVATSGSPKPAPAARVSARCRCQESSGPMAAATPPCARAVLPPTSRPLVRRTTGCARDRRYAARPPATPLPTTTTGSCRATLPLLRQADVKRSATNCPVDVITRGRGREGVPPRPGQTILRASRPAHPVHPQPRSELCAGRLRGGPPDRGGRPVENDRKPNRHREQQRQHGQPSQPSRDTKEMRAGLHARRYRADPEAGSGGQLRTFQTGVPTATRGYSQRMFSL